jgi:hypothetical protein
MPYQLVDYELFTRSDAGVLNFFGYPETASCHPYFKDPHVGVNCI